MKIIDCTKEIAPICTFDLKERSGHIDNLKLTANSAQMVAEMLVSLGYDEDAETVFNIAARVYSESQFLQAMPRVVYVKG